MSNQETVQAPETQEVQEAPAVQAPEGFAVFTETFHFRKFKDNAENRAEKLPSSETADHSIQVNTEVVEGVPMFQRVPEAHDLIVPTPALFGMVVPTVEGEAANTPEHVALVEAEAVLQETLTEFMKAAARNLVNQGITPNQENCSWDLVRSTEYKRISKSGAAAGSGISRELLKAVAESFEKYCIALGDKPQKGIDATCKMIRGRFNKMSVINFLPVLPKIQENLEAWFIDGLSEAEQEGYQAAMTYLLDQIEKAQQPDEPEDLDTLF